MPETDTWPYARPAVPYIQTPFDSKPARPRNVPNQFNLAVMSWALKKLQSPVVHATALPPSPPRAEPFWPDH